MTLIMTRTAILVALLAVVATAALADSYRLYRTSAAISEARVYVATFDASDLDNKENCEIVRALLLSQPGVTVLYWCEEARLSAMIDEQWVLDGKSLLSRPLSAR